VIFVSVGTALQPFDRLIAAVEDVADALEGHELVTQHGRSRAPRIGRAIATIPREEFEAHLGRAALVIGHAGVGSIVASLRHGKKPIVMPRRKAEGEMVSDHQVDLAEKLASLDLLHIIHNAGDLRRLLDRPLEEFRVDPPGHNCHVIEATRSFLESLGDREPRA
jgi:UDP-N-acetylglucosamine transferase subunit ALG13